ncbi:NAD-dependent succinate-semialdehyde dehydrogenase [Maribacter sp. Asnod1-A12]|uniref:NAD-dependent succinate-semialdehyde dehydrogenase n=1 Tax=Maribacter sp. Asnod1-A12 TaxID=3160576 RepID=UPI0038705AC4
MLLKDKSFINGLWVNAFSSDRFDIVNPANQLVIGSVPDMKTTETKDAIEAAHCAFKKWKNYSATERASYLKKWHQLILDNIEDLAKILTIEQGKPLAEAKGEILYGASFIEWFAEEARRVYGDVIPGHTRDSRIIVLKQPIGVVGAITPWNFPNAMITRKVAPALAAGCTVVIKPSELTPFSALALAQLAEEAGFPKGVINIVTSKSPISVGSELTTNPLVKKISFTGSTRVGKLLMQQCAASVKKVSMELGGNAPFIVFNDADIDKAVVGAIASKYRNAGQTCVCTNRIFVQSKVANEFIEKYTKAVKKLKVADGLDSECTIGPLINKEAVTKVEKLVDSAINEGASLVIGGKKNELGDLFYEPTILTNVTTSMEIANAEIFGPISTLFQFETEQEVIQMANDTPYGLASYFYGNNMSQIWRVAEALEYGMVGVNTGSISTTVAPFGGIKESGIGREGSKYGIDEYVVTKYINFSI